MRVGELEVPLPDDWDDRSLYTYVAPPEKTVPLRAAASTFRKNVVMQRRRLAADETLESCTEALVRETKEGHGDIAVDVSPGPSNEVLRSNCVAYRLVDPGTNQPVAQLLYVCVLDRFEWQIAVSLPAVDLGRARAEFDTIVGAIRRVG